MERNRKEIDSNHATSTPIPLHLAFSQVLFEDFCDCRGKESRTHSLSCLFKYNLGIKLRCFSVEFCQCEEIVRARTIIEG